MAKEGNAKKNDRSSREESEFVEKLISVRRVTKVVKGGKNLRFSALMVIGDGKGRIGYGTGKAREVPEAVRKATEQAKRTMIRIPMREGRTLHHDVTGHSGAALVHMRTAPAGTGIIAGGPTRAMCEVLGLQDVVSKSVGTSNYHNIVHATYEALRKMNTPRRIANKLNRKVSEIIARREGTTHSDSATADSAE